MARGAGGPLLISVVHFGRWIQGKVGIYLVWKLYILGRKSFK